jgi:hypothetical protein
LMALDDDTGKALEYETRFEAHRKESDDLSAVFKERLTGAISMRPPGSTPSWTK